MPTERMWKRTADGRHIIEGVAWTRKDACGVEIRPVVFVASAADLEQALTGL